MGTLSSVLVPHDPIPAHLAIDAGWLAGIYDGEGSALGISQFRSHNPEVCDRIEKTLDLLGFEWTYRDDTYFMLGGMKACIKMLNLPITRRAQLERLIFESKAGHYKHGDGRPPTLRRSIDRVVSVEPIGERPVVSMKTTTGNYIVSGYASSNCFTVGDEMPNLSLRKADIKRVLGHTPERADYSAEELLALASERWDVFHVMVAEGSFARRNAARVRKAWETLLGQNAIWLKDHRTLAQTIVSAIQIREGVHPADVIASWEGSAKATVEAAVVHIRPRGINLAGAI